MIVKLTSTSVFTASLLLVAAPTLRANDALPPFSWDHVPVYAHVGKSSDDFTSEELDFLAKHFDFITIEKGQASHKYGNTEDGFAAAAREIKKRNPDAKVLFYWNASLDTSTARWGYKAAKTFPADGHLKDKQGKPVLRRKTVPNYDLTRPDVRAWWSDAAAKAVRDYGADGIFADAMGDPPAANRKTLDEAQLKALRDARLALMEETRRKIGPSKLIVYNGLMKEGRDRLLRVTDGAMIEHFGHFSNGSTKEQIAEGIDVTQATGREGKIVLMKAWPGFSYREPEMMKKPHDELARLAKERITFPLACFLVAAQPNCYFCYTWGYREKAGTFEWYPEFDKPLGPPRGDATRTGWTYQRDFAHASVFVDLETRTARIDWKP
ncbi:MAG TPA: putative glycoside hydrolase [Phycisphaerae bacterium]|nr:putative glycoside hydrolase [Phycisphaerae bacterium]